MRRSRGRIAVAIVFALLALNAWSQALFVLLGRSDDPPMLTLLQVLSGASAVLTAVGSWSAARWAPAAAVSYGVITGGMIVLLDPLLDIGPEGRSGLWLGGLVVLVVSLGFAWYLRRSMAPQQPRGG